MRVTKENHVEEVVMSDLIEHESPASGVDNVIAKAMTVDCGTTCPQCGSCLELRPSGGP